MDRSAYPATYTYDAPERIANWRPLVHWFLAIPHFIVLGVMGFVAEVCVIVGWFAILFTGKLPQGLAGIQAMHLRYMVRTYAYAGFLVEEYPPFTYSTDADDPDDAPRVRVDFRLALEGRNRLTTFFRPLLVIPHVIVLALLGIAAFVCLAIGFFAVLFTGRWPEGIRDFVLGVARWSLRVSAYASLTTDEYPPFTLD